MEVLNGILKEELNRLRKLKKNYENKLKKIPKGSLIRKEIKRNIYYYLNYRDGGKSVFRYLGKLNKEEISKIKEKIEERRKLRKLYIQVKKNIVKMKKICNMR
jgi:hypothetical protein